MILRIFEVKFECIMREAQELSLSILKMKIQMNSVVKGKSKGKSLLGLVFIRREE